MTYRRRLLAAFAYVLVLVIVALAVPLALSTDRRLDREVRAQAADGAQLVAASASGRLKRLSDLDALSARVARNLGARVIIVGPKGGLLADSSRPGTRGVAYGDRPEIAEALTGRTVQGRRRSETLDQELLYTAVPVIQAGKTVGAVRVTQSVDAIDREIRRDQYALIGVGLLALAFGLVVAWFVAGSLTRPLRRLAVTAQRVGGGDLEARAVIEGSAEQREVARAFNTMADRLTNALEAQRAFVANASHQLRTPLTGLRLRIEAADMATDDPAVREQLAAADAETVRLARLVTNLLRLASADAPAPPSEPVDLAAAAREAQARWSGRAEQEGRHVACAPDEPATGVGSSDDLATSLDNLIENALEHSPSGGHRDDHLGRRRRRDLHRRPRRGPWHLTGGCCRGVRALPARRRPAGRARRNRARPRDRRSARRALGRLRLAAPARRGRYPCRDTPACEPMADNAGFTVPLPSQP